MKADEGIIARRYARALMLYADDHGGHDALLEELGRLAQALESVPGMAAVFHSPLLSRKQKLTLLESLKTVLQMSDAGLSFGNVLIQKGRTEYIDAIRQAFQRLLDERNGRVRATIESAVALDETKKRELLKALAQRFDKEVLPTFEVDQQLVAGVRARVGNTLLDSSLRGKLDALREQLKTLAV